MSTNQSLDRGGWSSRWRKWRNSDALLFCGKSTMLLRWNKEERKRVRWIYVSSYIGTAAESEKSQYLTGEKQISGEKRTRGREYERTRVWEYQFLDTCWRCLNTLRHVLGFLVLSDKSMLLMTRCLSVRRWQAQCFVRTRVLLTPAKPATVSDDEETAYLYLLS